MAFACIRDFLQSHDMKIYIVVPGITNILLPGKTFSAVKMHINKNYIEEYQQQKNQNISISLCDEYNAQLPSFSEMLIQYMEQINVKESDICWKANTTRQYFSEIKNNADYKPTKKEAISLGMALKLSLEEMSDFIGKAGYELTDNSKFDIIIKYCISQKCYDIVEINQILFRFEQPLLGGSNL